jgi:hypothetical protein
VVTYDAEKERPALNEAEGGIAWLDRHFESVYFEAGSAELRKKVPELLQALVQAGQLMVVDEE